MPNPIVIRRSEPSRVEIDWSDGSATSLSAAELRRLCPCARCVDEVSGVRTLDPGSIPDELTQVDVKLTGNYAITVEFSDGHHTGIFTWRLLHAWGTGAAGQA